MSTGPEAPRTHFRRLRAAARVAAPFAAVLAITAGSIGVAGSVDPVQQPRAADPAQISADPFTNPSSQHATEVEPDNAAHGNTVIAVFQQGRFRDGGSSGIGWARSGDRGKTWSNGSLPGLTRYSQGPWARVTDPSVAWDDRDGVWVAASLGLSDSGGVNGRQVMINRSTDATGTQWYAATTATPVQDSVDKSWIACDNTSTSPHYGNCYLEYDDVNAGDEILMTTSADGGQTWTPPVTTQGDDLGLGGQPLVQPDGRVVVPALSADGSSIIAFSSEDGGATWHAAVTVANVEDHQVAGGLRSDALPSAAMDAAGRIYVTWQDCRFRSTCDGNDIVMSTSDDGINWTVARRIPIDAAGGADHFIPGIGVDPATSGSTARLALAYYFYPDANCSTDCKLEVGLVSSTDGGTTWSTPRLLAGPMSLSWLAQTTQGAMVGDYMATSFAGGTAHPVYAVARPPGSNGQLDEAMDSPVGGVSVEGRGIG